MFFAQVHDICSGHERVKVNLYENVSSAWKLYKVCYLVDYR